MPYVEGKWIGPLETFYRAGFYIDSIDGHLNHLRAEALEKELCGLGVVIELEFPYADPPVRSLTDLLGYLRKKYALKCKLPEDALFEDIRLRLTKKSKKKSNRRR